MQEQESESLTTPPSSQHPRKATRTYLLDGSSKSNAGWLRLPKHLHTPLVRQGTIPALQDQIRSFRSWSVSELIVVIHNEWSLWLLPDRFKGGAVRAIRPPPKKRFFGLKSASACGWFDPFLRLICRAARRERGTTPLPAALSAAGTARQSKSMGSNRLIACVQAPWSGRDRLLHACRLLPMGHTQLYKDLVPLIFSHATKIAFSWNCRFGSGRSPAWFVHG